MIKQEANTIWNFKRVNHLRLLIEAATSASGGKDLSAVLQNERLLGSRQPEVLQNRFTCFDPVTWLYHPLDYGSLCPPLAEVVIPYDG